MPTGTYTQANIDNARSIFGDDPSAVARGVAQNMTQAPAMQEAIAGQGGAIDALGEIKAYDQELAGRVNQGNTAQMQNEQAQTQALANYGSAGATAQETINKGAQAIPELEMRAPTQGLLSPFVASSLSTGNVKAATDTYDLAAQTRAALTKAIGSEAENYYNVIKEQNMQKELADAKKLDLIKAFGGDYELDGKTYHFDTPEEKLEKERKANQSVLYRTGKSGASLLDEVVDGLGNFTDIIQENPDLTEEEIVALGRANVSKFGAFKESNQELQQMGLGALINAGLTREGATSSLNSEQLTNANTLRDEYLKQSTDFGKISSSYNKILSADETPAGDMGLIFGYMKILDPGSTVREGEYATAENAASIPERVRVQYNKALEGDKLSPEQRQDFKTQAGNVYSAEAERHELTKSEYERLAQRSGIDPNLVIVDFGTVGGGQENSGVVQLTDPNTGNVYSYPSVNDPDYINDIQQGFK